MPTAGDLTRCQHCPQAFADERSARAHVLLDHTAAPDGQELVEELLGGGPPVAAEPGPPQPPDPGAPPDHDLAARLGLVLVVAWVTAPLGLLLLVD